MHVHTGEIEVNGEAGTAQGAGGGSGGTILIDTRVMVGHGQITANGGEGNATGGGGAGGRMVLTVGERYTLSDHCHLTVFYINYNNKKKKKKKKT